MKKPNFDSFIPIKRSDNSDYSSLCINYSTDDWYDTRTPIGFPISVNQSKEKRILETPIGCSFNLLGSTVILPEQLRHIYDEIIDSFYILELEQNWDDQGALPIPIEVFRSSIQLLVDYSLAALKVHNTIIDTPEINPGPDGSIDLSWRTNQARLLINVKLVKGETKIRFYRDHYNNEKSNRGDLYLDIIDESFLIWMKFLK